MDASTGIFISHHTHSTEELVRALSDLLETCGVKHWFAERDIRPMENYAEVIPGVIERCELLVLLLNEESNASRQVLREVQYAERLKKPVLVARLDDCDESQTIAYLGATDQQLDLRSLGAEQKAQKLAAALCAWKAGEQPEVEPGALFQYERAENSLEFYGDEGERERLQSQREFIYEFAHEEYDALLSSVRDAVFLDVGCSTGEQAMLFLDGRSEIRQYVGVDKEAAALEKGRELFPQGLFCQCDCESDAFDDALREIEQTLDIDGFDVIHISMLLLHLKEPQILMDTLRGHLNEGGRFLILDIDDGLNVAYPDPDGVFGRAVEICAQTGYSGFRRSGRQIPQLLYDVEMEDVRLLKQGLSTVGMPREKRTAFFNLYFWFILDDLRKMHTQAPQDKLIESEWQWFEKNYKDMKNQFKKKGFFFNLGFLLFSAQ